MAWQQDSSPANTRKMLDAVHPMITASVRQHTQSKSPVVLGKAKAETLKALRRYDPSKARPQTFISQQLQGLHRWNSARTNGVRLPVRAANQAVMLERISLDLEDKLGRPASTAEIARKANLTSSAVAKIRSFGRPTAASQQTPGEEPDVQATAEDQMLKPRDDQAWLEMIYDDLSDRDKVVMEYTTGMFGRRPLSTSALAKKLKISPGAVSQRRKKVQQYIDRAMQVNPL